MTHFHPERFISTADIVLCALALCSIAVIFVADINVPLSINIGSIYSVVILYSWVLPGKNFSVFIATLCTALVIWGAILAPSSGEGDRFTGINTLISIIVLWVTTSLVLIAKYTMKNMDATLASLEDNVYLRTSELVESKNLLEKSERRYKKLLEAAPDAVVIFDENGFIQYINIETVLLFGFDSNELLGVNVRSLMGYVKNASNTDDTSYNSIDAYLNDIETIIARDKKLLLGGDLNVFAKRKSGEEFPIEISLGPLEINDGVLISASVRDVSERKEHIEELNHSAEMLNNKNKELEQFVYIASHDLQEPLCTLMSFIERLESELNCSLSPRQQQYIKFISQSASRASALVKCLLEYGRLGRSSEVTDVDCNSLVAGILDDLSDKISKTNAAVTVEKLPQIKGFAIELRCLFQNLLTNAIKFQRDGLNPEVHIASKAIDNGYQFSIKDNGIGIDLQHQEKIFQIFQRLHARDEYEGMGIGLSHARKIVELHQGRIWFDSVPGEGATFYFTVMETSE